MTAQLRPTASRRLILRRLLQAAVGLPLAAALAAMLRRVEAGRAPATVGLPADLADGLSIAGGAIVHRAAGGAVTAFSARCTHLGCRIDRVAGGQAVCPCHGSRFRADGSVASGPAGRPLRPLRVDADAASGGWTVHVA